MSYPWFLLPVMCFGTQIYGIRYCVFPPPRRSLVRSVPNDTAFPRKFQASKKSRRKLSRSLGTKRSELLRPHLDPRPVGTWDPGAQLSNFFPKIFRVGRNGPRILVANAINVSTFFMTSWNATTHVCTHLEARAPLLRLAPPWGPLLSRRSLIEKQPCWLSMATSCALRTEAKLLWTSS